MNDDSRGGSPVRAAAAAAAVALACAVTATPSGGPAPDADSLAAARHAPAGHDTADALAEARAKLERAGELAREGRHAEARRLAEEAAVDADVAHARADAERLRQTLARFEQRSRGEHDPLVVQTGAPLPIHR